MDKSIPAAETGSQCNKAEETLEQVTKQSEEQMQTGPITSGKFFEALSDIYVRYCDISAKLVRNDRKIVAFSVGYETRKTNGLWSTHPCYKVHFSDQEILPFSMKQSLNT
ncbi:hypothetical protein [Pseudoalteromonas luteoviolacea]|uniref:Uncharacterized protein n=1 Tax=Pseudoalteromonas luteoviolacea S4054 TaxID=1129367 RepID=A0A0F6A7F6_9GAMM|nr:hypothetical protein [Pseudoalteromonas luteoviolacea]AOT07581.1 hypothetical protein S4054249_06885 [Pseudoalteromonas luteoviolacea]AOT12497.1 hypothetical protein S40542_06885 [Pseudoalteromonas luteoviolacea]AOT17411.1 hypothetical protein S4054_06885 [Pseudoalteromonas luteoviolacea]KKE81319.1 hypothetical protein N479_22550 [Pseudoalteromonas luteoviolacea S4054]KZN70672.1 hypothetical protein N481_20885 [Pseudoalteromonas luteoviolacea S4047-1]